MPNALVANLYNPHEQSKEELIQRFVVRQKLFQQLFQDIKSADMTYPEPHYLIEGQRGMGKTTLLLRLSYEIENDRELNPWLIPVVLKEEAYYGVIKLYDLWLTVAQVLETRDHDFAGVAGQIKQAYQNQQDYERASFDILRETLEKHGKKLLLCIDNFGEMVQHFSDQESHRLREILMTCPHLRVIAATAVVLEAFFAYKHAFYEFFKVKRLAGLDKEETRAMLLELARQSDKEAVMQTILTQHPGRVESLRILTGGVLRTIVLLFEIFVDNVNGNALTDLEAVFDRVTPLYKHRMDDLTPMQRKVINAIALHWDAVSVEEIAGEASVDVDQIAPVLYELEKILLIQRVPTTTQVNLYRLQERFFNIWYLMRVGPQGSQTKVIWLVRFLECWYEPEDLRQRAKQHIKAMSKGSFHPKAAYYMTEALSWTGKLDMNTEYQLIRATRKYLAKKDKSLGVELSPSDKELFQEGWEYSEKSDFKKATDSFFKIKNKNEIVNSCLAYSFHGLKDYKKTVEYCYKAVEQGSIWASYHLGITYHDYLHDYQKAEEWYLKTLERSKTHASAMLQLAELYHYKLKNYEQAEKYYTIASRKRVPYAMHNLGILYKYELKNPEKAKKCYQKAEKYYLIAVEREDADAMCSLGNLYYDGLKDYAKAEKYYLMAVEHGDVDAIAKLGDFYADESKDYAKAEKYYLMASEKGHKFGLNNLAWMLCEQKVRKGDALKYILGSIEQVGENIYNRYNLSWIYLWHNQIDEALKLADKIIIDKEMIEEFSKQYSNFIMLLLAKQQYRYVTKYFDSSDLDLKERFKPLYYALLHFTHDEAYAKLPPELAEPVNNVIEKVKQMAVDYA